MNSRSIHLGFLYLVQIAIGLAFASCEAQNATSIGEVPLPGNTKVSELLKHAEKAASNGEGSIIFTHNGNRLVLEFPLLDGHKKHWQFKVLQELEARNLNHPGKHLVGKSLALWLKRRGGRWNLGESELSNEKLANQVALLASKNEKLVVVCQIGSEETLDAIADLWKQTQAHNSKFIIFPD